MHSQFPKLQKKLDEILWKFEQELQEAIEGYELEDVELSISDANFIPRSPVTKVAFYLRQILDSCFEEEPASNTRKISSSKIEEEHVSAAEGLLKIGKYQETAIDVLTQALLKTGASKETKEIKKLASKALAECGTAITSFNEGTKNEEISYFNEFCKGKDLYESYEHPNGKKEEILIERNSRKCG